MPIKSIKEKINNIASGEILGEADKEKEPKKKVPSDKKRIEKKPKKVKKPSVKKEKVEKDNFFKRKEIVPEVIEKEELIVKTKKEEPSPPTESIHGYEDVLQILGVKDKLNIETDFNSNDMDYIEFSQTTPLGFDFEEVTDFISRVKYTLNKLESALQQRDKDVITLASEVKKVEERMVEKSQEMQLSKMIGGMTKEEELIEKNFELKTELNELRNKFLNGESSQLSKKVERELEALRAENEMLRMNSLNSETTDYDFIEKNNNSLPKINNNGNSLPNLDIEENSMPNIDEIDFNDNDSVDNMINQIGGMYDDE